MPRPKKPQTNYRDSCIVDLGSLLLRNKERELPAASLKIGYICCSKSQLTAAGRGYSAHMLPLHMSWEEEAKNLTCCSVLQCYDSAVTVVQSETFIQVIFGWVFQEAWVATEPIQQTNLNYTFVPLSALVLIKKHSTPPV